MKITSDYEILKPQERKHLLSLILPHGALTKAAQLTDLTTNTIKRAKDGLPIKPENAALIRHILLS